jgi:hypothetical protein
MIRFEAIMIARFYMLSKYYYIFISFVCLNFALVNHIMETDEKQEDSNFDSLHAFAGGRSGMVTDHEN